MLGSQAFVLFLFGFAGLVALLVWIVPRLQRIHPQLPSMISAGGAVAVITLSVLARHYSQAIAFGALTVLVAGSEWMRFRYPGAWINRPIGQLMADRRAAKRVRNR